jgi:hypothetical protein
MEFETEQKQLTTQRRCSDLSWNVTTQYTLCNTDVDNNGDRIVLVTDDTPWTPWVGPYVNFVIVRCYVLKAIQVPRSESSSLCLQKKKDQTSLL